MTQNQINLDNPYYSSGAEGFPSDFRRQQTFSLQRQEPAQQNINQPEQPAQPPEPTEPTKQKTKYQELVDSGKDVSPKKISEILSSSTNRDRDIKDLQEGGFPQGDIDKALELLNSQKQTPDDKSEPITYDNVKKKQGKDKANEAFRVATIREYNNTGDIKEAVNKVASAYGLTSEEARNKGVTGETINLLLDGKSKEDVVKLLAEGSEAFNKKDTIKKFLKSQGWEDDDTINQVWSKKLEPHRNNIADLENQSAYFQYEYNSGLKKAMDKLGDNASEEDKRNAKLVYDAEFIKNQVKQTSTNRRFIQGARTFVDGLLSIADSVLPDKVSSKIGLKDAANTSTEYGAMVDKLSKEEVGTNIAGILGEIAGLVAGGVGNLTSKAPTFLGRVAGDAAIGAGVSSVTASGKGKEGKELAKEAIIGAGIGGSLRGVVDGVAKGYEAGVKALLPKDKEVSKDVVKAKLETLKAYKTLGIKRPDILDFPATYRRQLLANDISKGEVAQELIKINNRITTEIKKSGKVSQETGENFVSSLEGIVKAKSDQEKMLSSAAYDRFNAKYGEKVLTGDQKKDLVKHLTNIREEAVRYANNAVTEPEKTAAHSVIDSIDKLSEAGNLKIKDIVALDKQLKASLKNWFAPQGGKKLEIQSLSDALKSSLPKGAFAELTRANNKYIHYITHFGYKSTIGKGLKANAEKGINAAIYDGVKKLITEKSETSKALLEKIGNLQWTREERSVFGTAFFKESGLNVLTTTDHGSIRESFKKLAEIDFTKLSSLTTRHQPTREALNEKFAAINTISKELQTALKDAGTTLQAANTGVIQKVLNVTEGWIKGRFFTKLYSRAYPDLDKQIEVYEKLLKKFENSKSPENIKVTEEALKFVKTLKETDDILNRSDKIELLNEISSGVSGASTSHN